MNIDIKLIENSPFESSNESCGYESLTRYRSIYENFPIIVDNISYDIGLDSLQRLEFISLLDYEIEFFDSNNETLSLSGSEIKTILPTIKNNLGIRYNKISKIYNTLKGKLSGDSANLSHYEALSCFHEGLYDSSFTQKDYDEIKDVYAIF